MAEGDSNPKKEIVFAKEYKPHTDDDKSAVSLEDALDMIGMGRYNYGLYAVCNVMLLAMAIEIFGSSYVVAAGACDLHLTTETKGLVAAMPMLGIVLSSHLWGWLADTRGRRTVLLLSMTGSFLFSMACSLASGWVTLAAFKFAAAFFASASNAVTYALFGECTPSSHRNKLVMLMSSGLMFAQGAMSLNAYPILRLDFDYQMFGGLRYKPWRLLEQVYGAWSGLAALLLLFFVKESPKFYASQGRMDDAVRILGEIFTINTGKKIGEYPVKSVSFHETSASKAQSSNVLRSMWDQTVPLFKAPLRGNTLIILYIVILVYSISPAFLMWMPTITNAFSRASSAGHSHKNFCQLIQLGRSSPQPLLNGTVAFEPECVDKVEDLTFIILTSFSAAMSITNAFNSFLSKYVGKRSLVIFLHVVGGVSGLVLPLIYDTNASLVVFFMFQANLIAMGLTTGFTVEVYPTYLRAMAVCLTMMIGRGSSFLLISYVGVLLESHCDATIYAFGAVILSGALVGLLLPAEQKRDSDKADIANSP